MIIDRHDLQALQCTVCLKLYELPRERGHERQMNSTIAYKKSLTERHANCKPKANHHEAGRAS